MNFKSGHVVLLSDGHANEGIVDPSSLRSHADEMASRGVTTSAVGVGNGYSPLQLEALSEGGLGRLHDAGTPDEMIETILGELGEVDATELTGGSGLTEAPRELRTFFKGASTQIAALPSRLAPANAIMEVVYPLSEHSGWQFVALETWGTRRAPGEIQMAISDVL